MVFARDLSAPVTSLVKKIEACTDKNKDKKMCSFAVFMSDDENLEKKLKEFAEKDKIDKCALTIDNPSGPGPYKIAKDADVTVLLYVKKHVKVNHAFKKGELNDEAIAKVLKDVPKMFEKD
ncbi:MAG TPA: hypothetical protein VKE94_12185 [Gemmataceae bacterium]|nr:hypothetical protein [Gemmataceae bacterium]